MKYIQFFLFTLGCWLFTYFFIGHHAEKYQDNKVDVIVFSYNRPMQLFAFLESFTEKSTNYGNIFVVVRSDKNYESAYQEVEQSFPKAQFTYQKKPKKDFKEIVMELSFNPQKSLSKYICYAVDDIIVKEAIEFNDAITALETSKAYGFFFRLGKDIDYCYMQKTPQKIPPFEQKNNWLVFSFNKGTHDWNYPNNLDMTLYRKKDIFKELKQIDFTFPNDMEAMWDPFRKNKNKGACYLNPKIINIPLNVVSDFQNINMEYSSAFELLELFQKGFKIDVSSFSKVKTSSVHADIKPALIQR
ncbi:MAG: hypothetical protein COT84_01690 [Chlamydiae bacterium CG10_big_fil_rev_8_21_14_0_10_35_9]|nr:MAG: hypothetical protein COT84_01690 [Chlamydiae bacterium CG10_big_fil_rev_8_21_14_0_10_35_9]